MSNIFSYTSGDRFNMMFICFALNLTLEWNCVILIESYIEEIKLAEG